MPFKINFKDFKARNPFRFKARTTEGNNLLSGLEAQVEIVPDFEVEEGTELNSAFFKELEQGINDELEVRDKQINSLSSPYVIPEGSDIPIQDRVKGKMYFKVTSRQSGGSSNGIIKVSPNMGIEIKE